MNTATVQIIICKTTLKSMHPYPSISLALLSVSPITQIPEKNNIMLWF